MLSFFVLNAFNWHFSTLCLFRDYVPPDVAAYKYLPMFNKVLLSAFDGQ